MSRSCALVEHCCAAVGEVVTELPDRPQNAILAYAVEKPPVGLLLCYEHREALPEVIQEPHDGLQLVPGAGLWEPDGMGHGLRSDVRCRQDVHHDDAHGNLPRWGLADQSQIVPTPF